jgi:hypothetical protein
MPDIMDGKQEKVFIRIDLMLQRNILWSLLISVLAGYSSCSPQLTDAAIPFQAFGEVHLNLNLPEYQSLRTDGGWKYLDKVSGMTVGVRGIILYRLNATTYIAYERNCSFHPNDACATVEVHSSNLYMLDACCGSSFSLATGSPTGGAAWRPLRKYETLLTSSDLTITDEIVE